MLITPKTIAFVINVIVLYCLVCKWCKPDGFRTIIYIYHWIYGWMLHHCSYEKAWTLNWIHVRLFFMTDESNEIKFKWNKIQMEWMKKYEAEFTRAWRPSILFSPSAGWSYSMSVYLLCATNEFKILEENFLIRERNIF